jgi:hypothetical protein
MNLRAAAQVILHDTEMVTQPVAAIAALTTQRVVSSDSAAASLNSKHRCVSVVRLAAVSDSLCLSSLSNDLMHEHSLILYLRQVSAKDQVIQDLQRDLAKAHILNKAAGHTATIAESEYYPVG